MIPSKIKQPRYPLPSFKKFSNLEETHLLLNTKISFFDLIIQDKFLTAPHINNLPIGNDVMPLSDCLSESGVLLYQ